jgi:hypothetical protein
MVWRNIMSVSDLHNRVAIVYVGNTLPDHFIDHKEFIELFEKDRLYASKEILGSAYQDYYSNLPSNN